MYREQRCPHGTGQAHVVKHRQVLACMHAWTTHHDSLVTHIELGLSRDQGHLVLLDNWGDPAEGILIFITGKAGEKAALVTRLLCPRSICACQAAQEVHRDSRT